MIFTLSIDSSSPWFPYQFDVTSPFYQQKFKCILLPGVRPGAPIVLKSFRECDDSVALYFLLRSGCLTYLRSQRPVGTSHA